MTPALVLLPVVLALARSAAVPDWEKSIALGQQALADGRYADAYENFHASMQQAQAFGENDTRYAVALRMLADVVHALGRATEAETIYVRSLAIHERVTGPNSREVADVLRSLALLYRTQARYEAAELACRRSLNIMQRIPRLRKSDLRPILSTLASIQFGMGRYDEAVETFTRALTLPEGTLKDEVENTATLTNLGQTLHTLGRYQQAEGVLKTALRRREKILGTDHPFVAHTLMALAHVMNAQGNRRVAEDMWTRVITIVRPALGSDHPDLAAAEASLGMLYSSEGRTDAAEALLSDALRIQRISFGEEHPNTAAVLSNLGALNIRRRQFATAREWYARALNAYSKSQGNDVQVARVLNNLALTHAAQKQYSAADRLYAQALELAERTLPADHPDLATYLSNRADTLRKLGRKQEAKLLSQRAEEIRMQNPGVGTRYRIDYRDLGKAATRH